MSIERILKRAIGKNVPGKSSVTQPQSGSAETLALAFDDYFNSLEKEHIKKINGFHPSYTRICQRWWFLLFKGVPSKAVIPPRLRRIFDNGNKVHERYYEYFEAMGILVDSEIPLKVATPVPIVGTADGVINWDGNKLIEMKSISEEGFQFRKFYNKPKEDHMIQAQIYLHALKLEDGFVIYESKNNQNILIFPIKKDEEIYNKKIRQWTKVYNKIKKNELPKRPYKKDSQTCQECDLLNHCWEVLKD